MSILKKLRIKILEDKKVLEYYYNLPRLDVVVKTINSGKRSVSFKNDTFAPCAQRYVDV